MYRLSSKLSKETSSQLHSEIQIPFIVLLNDKGQKNVPPPRKKENEKEYEDKHTHILRCHILKFEESDHDPHPLRFLRYALSMRYYHFFVSNIIPAFNVPVGGSGGSSLRGPPICGEKGGKYRQERQQTK